MFRRSILPPTKRRAGSELYRALHSHCHENPKHNTTSAQGDRGCVENLTASIFNVEDFLHYSFGRDRQVLLWGN
jgi:hypothetical protein